MPPTVAIQPCCCCPSHCWVQPYRDAVCAPANKKGLNRSRSHTLQITWLGPGLTTSWYSSRRSESHKLKSGLGLPTLGAEQGWQHLRAACACRHLLGLAIINAQCHLFHPLPGARAQLLDCGAQEQSPAPPQSGYPRGGLVGHTAQEHPQDER